MFMVHQIELLVNSALNYGMGKAEFRIEGGNSTGFSVTHIFLQEEFRVINTGLTTKAYYGNKVDHYSGNVEDISQFRKSFMSWIMFLVDKKRVKRLSEVDQDL